MPKRREIRRLAMQVLYQLDVRGEEDLPLIAEGLVEGPDAPSVQEAAIALAQGAWEKRQESDAFTTELAPDWPTHRQPPVDRAILRLAYYEMVSGHAPVKVAINEAVTIAKHFCSEQSPAFINGVLDKLAKKLIASHAVPEPEEAPASHDDWLKDAIE